jgi:hypothetical protein
MKNFIIVGTQRTGSSALAEGISTHPKIACGWEWTQRVNALKLPTISKKALFNHEFDGLNEKNREYAQSIFREDLEYFGYRRLFRASSRWFLHPYFSPLVVIERLDWHLDWIVENQISVIHIVIADNLGWLKSKAVTKKTGSFSGEKYADDIQAEIAPSEALKRIKAKHWLDGKLASLKDRTPYIQVVYEEFKENNFTEVKRVIEFLGQDPALLPSLDTEMKLKPQSSKPDTEMLSNYVQLASVLEKNSLLSYKTLKD